MNEEIWKKVKGFEKYEVSSMGRARSYNKTSNTYRILNPCVRNNIMKQKAGFPSGTILNYQIKN